MSAGTKWKRTSEENRPILTTRHIIGSNTLDGVCRLVFDITHPDTGAVALIDIVNEEVSEARMSVSDLGSCHCQQ